MVYRPETAVVDPDRSKRSHIVVPQVARVVLALRQRHMLLGEDVAKTAEMERLGVGDDAIKVEDDRAQHV